MARPAMAAAAWLICLGWLTGCSAAEKPYNITIGYLPALLGNYREHVGLTMSGAISIAIEEINNSTDILPEVKILMEWHDTKADTVTATRLLTDMSHSGVVAFFGPEGRCRTEAIVAQARNLPMISYNCFEQTSDHPTLARLESPEDQAMKAMVSLLRYYRWERFSILYEESWEITAKIMETSARYNNLTLDHFLLVEDQFKCCEMKRNCCSPHVVYDMVQNTMHNTRIYVYLGSVSGLVDFMSAMNARRLFDAGEYMVIFVDTVFSANAESLARYLLPIQEHLDWQSNCSATPAFMKQARSLLVINVQQPSQSYVDFTDEVLEYNKLPPFYLPDRKFSIKGFPEIKKHVSIYGAYLYESVKMYARALDDIIKQDTKNEELTYAKLMTIATNGSRIVAGMKKMPPSLSKYPGLVVKFVDQAGSGSNFTLSAFKHARYYGSSCPYNMVTVAEFKQEAGREYPIYRVNPRRPIDWPAQIKPEDRPLYRSHGSADTQLSCIHIVITAILLVIPQWIKNYE